MPGTEHRPAGTEDVPGVISRRSPYTVSETVERLTTAINRAGAEIFCVVDHSGEAERVGQLLRDTKLLVFGNPSAGTPVMQQRPLAALDLPLKVLVWRDDAGGVWMSYLSGSWLAQRHAVAAEQAEPLSAPDVLAGAVGGN